MIMQNKNKLKIKRNYKITKIIKTNKIIKLKKTIKILTITFITNPIIQNQINP